MRNHFLPALIFICIVSLLARTAEVAADDGAAAQNLSISWWNELNKGIRSTTRVLFSAAYGEIAPSTQNPQNSFLHLPQLSLKTELRPDFYLLYNQFDITFKPRCRVEWQKWQQREDSITDTDNDCSVLEWRIKAQASDTFFLSWGWENLQWGPSYLASPANPFFYDNGRLKPREEIKGLDIARLIWVPGEKLTVSLIANPGKGADDTIRDFQQKYAVKLDYMAGQYYGSLIASCEKDDKIQLGGFAGVTASDALLLYLEGGVHKGTPTYYPVTSAAPFNIMLSNYRQDDGVEGRLLGGASYTLESGSTLVVEYLYNSAGYNDEQTDNYYKLREKAAAAYTAADPLMMAAAKQLGLAVDPGFGCMHRNYLLVQYRKSELFDMADITLSWIQNLDDGSLRLIPNIDIAISDQAVIYLHGMFNQGGEETEYNARYRFQIMAGLEFTF